MDRGSTALCPDAPGRPLTRRRARALLVAALLGLLGLALLPVAPVIGTTSTVTWPAAGGTAESTMLPLLPYRPLDLRVTVPCEAASAEDGPRPDLLFSTFPLEGPGSGQGLVVSADGGAVRVVSEGGEVWRGDVPSSGCSLHVEADGDGTTVRVDDEVVAFREIEPPRVASLATGLGPTPGLSATLETDSRYEIRPAALKLVVLAVLLLCALACLAMLRAADGPRTGRVRPSVSRRLWPLDAVLAAVLLGWAFLGPVQPDDGYKIAVAAGFGETGFPGNRYYWYNAPESPFGLVEQLLVPLIELTRAPWALRLPAVVAALLLWGLLTRRLLPRLTGRAVTGLAGWLTLVCLLAWWLPYNSTLRSEAWVALGSATVLWLLLRAVDEQRLLPVALAGLVAALTLATSPVGVVAAAPFLVLAGRLLPLLRGRGAWPPLLAAAVVLPGAVALLVAVFADQSLATVYEATRVHSVIGPSLSWWEEYIRYDYLFSLTDMGSYARRLPMLLALGAVLLVLATRSGGRRDGAPALLGVTTSCLVLGLLLLTLVPSKWSHHFGAVAGFAVLVTVGAVLSGRAALLRDLGAGARVAVAGVAVMLVAAGFAGPDLWWSYGTLLVDPEPAAVLRNPLLWAVVAAVTVVVAARVQRRRSTGPWLRAAPLLAGVPVALVGTALGTSVAVMLSTHSGAAVALADSWSMVGQNAGHLRGGECGMADDVRVLRPEPLPGVVGGPADEQAPAGAFAVGSGALFDDGPVDLTGSALRWGTFGVAPEGEPPESGTGILTTRWFSLGGLAAGDRVGVLLSGRTGAGNDVLAEFAAQDDLDEVLGRLRPRARDEVFWRTARLAVPPGADAVRLVVTDSTTGVGGWLAASQPVRLRPSPLTDLLADEPVHVDWPFVSSFPCAQAPVMADGLTGLPRYALLSAPGLRPGDADALAFDERQGGTLAMARQASLSEVLPTVLPGLPVRRPGPVKDWGTLVAYRYAHPEGRYDLDVAERPVPATSWGYRYPVPIPPEPLSREVDRGVDKGRAGTRPF